MHTQERGLVRLNLGLLVFGIRMATRAGQAGPPRLRPVAAVLGCDPAGFLLTDLPRLLGRPHGVVMTLDTLACVPFAAAVQLARHARNFRRATEG